VSQRTQSGAIVTPSRSSYCSEPRLAFNRIVVLRCRSHLESRQLAPGTINLRLGAVRRLAYEAANCGLLSTDLAAGIRRVKGVKKLGLRLGNWLTAEQGHARCRLASLLAGASLVGPFELDCVVAKSARFPSTDVTDFTILVVIPTLPGNRVSDRFAQLVRSGRRESIEDS
jgi:hypothetical protein